MDNHYQQLDECESYDELTKHLCEKRIIRIVQSRYPHCNSRIILAAYIIKNHPNVIHASELLVAYSKELIEKLKNDDNLTGQELYFIEFEKWKTEDSCKLQEEICSGIQMLEAMKVNEDNDADKDWNIGVNSNIEILRNSIDTLKSFSPPT